MAFQMGATPQSVHPRDSQIGHMKALSQQGSSVRLGSARTPDYHSLMLRDPRTPSDAPQQRGATSPGAYNPLRSTRPAQPGNQGGGEAPDMSGVEAATGNFGHVLGPTVQSNALSPFGNMAKGTTVSTAAQLAMAVQNGLISATEAAKIAPSLAMTSFANPVAMASMFGSALGTGLAAADAAAAGEAALSAGATSSTADLTAMSGFHSAPLGLSSLGSHAMDAIGGLLGVGEEAAPAQAAHTANLSDNSPTDPSMSLSESQAALSTVQGQQAQNTAFLTNLLEQQGNMTPAQVAAALNASLGMQGVSTDAEGGTNSAGFGFGTNIGEVAPGITQGDPSAFGQVDITGTSPDMVAAMMAEAAVEAGVSTGNPETDAAIDAALSAAFGDNEGVTGITGESMTDQGIAQSGGFSSAVEAAEAGEAVSMGIQGGNAVGGNVGPGTGPGGMGGGAVGGAGGSGHGTSGVSPTGDDTMGGSIGGGGGGVK